MNTLNKDIYICYMIVNDNRADRVENLYRKHNAGFVLNQPCKGTVNSAILNAIGVSNSNRSYIQAMFSKKRLMEFMEEAKNIFKLDEPGHGILFVKKTNHIMFSKSECLPESEEKSMTNDVLITVITNYGKTKNLIRVARENGAHGATILKGHGTVSEDAQKFFGVAIEPEKEVIMLIVNKEIEKQVMEAIYNEGQFEKASNGIVFSQELHHTMGIAG